MSGEKVIIVEGSSDRKKIQHVINEPVKIVCTNGTIGLSKLDELADLFEDEDVYVLVDADDSGDKLRKQLKRALPHAYHIYVDRAYREVANCPLHHIVTVLLTANIDVHSEYLEQK